MWKTISVNEHTWVHFKTNFQEAHLDGEELELMAGAAGYGSAKNVTNGEIEDEFMNFASVTAATDVAFTEMKTENENLN